MSYYNVESSENLYFKSYAIGRLVGIGIFRHNYLQIWKQLNIYN